MYNFYSDKIFQDIADLKKYEPINLSVDFNRQKFKLNGILINNEITFGIYSPFWLPDFLFVKDRDNRLYEKVIEKIVDFKLKKKNKKIFIKLAPNIYNENIDFFKKFLIKYGFKIEKTFIQSYLDLKRFKNKDEYIRQLSSSSKNNINYFKKKLKIKEISNKDILKIKSSYKIIAKNREIKKRKLKYNFRYLLKLIEKFNDKIKIYSLFDDKKIIAASICHETFPEYVYIANWGDFHDYKKNINYFFYSEMLEIFLKEKYKILDFGIACELNEKDSGLLKFKKNLRNNFLKNEIFSL